MPRPRRLQLPGIPQHVVHRGVDRQPVFFDDADRASYLLALADSARWYGLAVHAYCLMSNHVHLLVTPQRPDSVSCTMRRMGALYVGRVNRRYGRTGTLWESRYRSCLVDHEHYFLICQRYIELNPLRAGLVDHPGEYLWSSHRYHALGQQDELLSPHEIYLDLAATDIGRQQAYRSLFQDALSPEMLDNVRSSLQHNHVLGADRFKSRIEKMTGRRLGTGRPGRPEKRRNPEDDF